MGLKTKLVLTVNAIVIVACTIMGVIGYLRAEESFTRAMQMKVGSDVNSLAEILNSRYEGNWQVRNGVLYKGEQDMEKKSDLLAELGKIQRRHPHCYHDERRYRRKEGRFQSVAVYRPEGH